MECEVHERYVVEEGLFEHNTHLIAARAVLFENYATDHRMSVSREVSPRLVELAHRHAGGLGVFRFLRGLDGDAPSA